MTPEESRRSARRSSSATPFTCCSVRASRSSRAHGGLHRSCTGRGPILTDSGGFQVWSLQTLRKITERGVEFRSPINGDLVILTPERSIEMQHALGTDIVDGVRRVHAVPGGARAARESMELSLRWAKRSRAAFDARSRNGGPALFGIVQGGVHQDLRRESLAGLQARSASTGTRSAARGRRAKAESALAVLEGLAPQLPTEAALSHGRRHAGRSREAVARGIDMFDCVIPTRHARNGQLFTSEGAINIRNSALPGTTRADRSQLRAASACRHYSRSYLRHLQQCNEILGARLATHHNLHFYLT